MALVTIKWNLFSRASLPQLGRVTLRDETCMGVVVIARLSDLSLRLVTAETGTNTFQQVRKSGVQSSAL
jgi:hypothetical protein